MSKGFEYVRESVIYALAAALALGIPALIFWTLWIIVTGNFGSSTIGPVTDLVGRFLTALAGAAVGAYFAFKYNKDEKKRDENRRNAEAASLAVIRLSLMFTAYHNYRSQVILPAKAKNPQTLWYHLPPGSFHVGPTSEIDLGTLKFLFQASDLHVIAELGIEEQRYWATNEIMERRSRMHHEEMQVAIQAKNLTGSVLLSDIESAIGPRINQSMKDYTKFILENVDLGLKTTVEMAKRLRAAAQPLVGGEKVVGFVPPDEDSTR